MSAPSLRAFGTTGATVTTADCVWPLYALSVAPVKPVLQALRPLPSVKRLYTELGLLRWRHDAWSLSGYRASERLLRIVVGEFEILAVQIAQACFGFGRFETDRLATEGQAFVLHSTGEQHPRRPGCELPLGRRVPIEQWEAAANDRTVRRLPPARSELRFTLSTNECVLTYRTLDGVPAQMTFDVPIGTAISDNGRRWQRLRAGECRFVGRARFSYLCRGKTIVRLGPGADAHAMARMRDIERTKVNHRPRNRCHTRSRPRSLLLRTRIHRLLFFLCHCA